MARAGSGMNLGVDQLTSAFVIIFWIGRCSIPHRSPALRPAAIRRQTAILFIDMPGAPGSSQNDPHIDRDDRLLQARNRLIPANGACSGAMRLMDEHPHCRHLKGPSRRWCSATNNWI